MQECGLKPCTVPV